MTVTVPTSAVPTLNGMYGPFHAQAAPEGGGNLLGLTYSMDLTKQTFVNGTPLAASPVINGSVDEQFGLTLGFVGLDSSGLNPELTSNFELKWNFANSPAVVSSLAGFGEAPTVSLSSVSMDLGPVLKNTIGQLLTPILADIKPLVTLANVFATPNPALQSLGVQINGLLGAFNSSTSGDSSDQGPIETILDFLNNPSLDNMITIGAQAVQNLDPDDAALYGYAEDVASALDSIHEIANFAQTINSLQDEKPDFGSFTLGGSGSNDLRQFAAGVLANVPIVSSTLGTGLDAIKSALAWPAPAAGPDNTQNPFQVTLNIPMLDDPTQAFDLLMGDTHVKIVELDTKVSLSDAADIQLFNENFVIGIVPVNFQIDFTVPNVDFALDMGLDSSGLGTGQPSQGLYVNAGPKTPLFSVDPTLKIRFGVGWDMDLVSIVAGISGDIGGQFDLYFADPNNDGIDYLDDLPSFPLQGNGQLTATLALFYDAKFNLTLAVLEQTLKTVFEIFVEANPLSLQANLLVNGIKGLDPHFTVPPGVEQLLNDPTQSVNAVLAGLKSVGYQASQTFETFISNPAQGLQDLGNDINHAGSQAASTYHSVVNTVTSCCGSWGLVDSGSGGSDTDVEGTPFFSQVLYQFTVGQPDAATNIALADGTTTTTGALATQSGGTLTLDMGPLASQRGVAPTATNEFFVIRPTDPNNPRNGSVTVSAFGTTETYTGCLADRRHLRRWPGRD